MMDKNQQQAYEDWIRYKARILLSEETREWFQRMAQKTDNPYFWMNDNREKTL